MLLGTELHMLGHFRTRVGPGGWCSLTLNLSISITSDLSSAHQGGKLHLAEKIEH